MKKKISLILCVLAVVFSFTACGNASSNEKTYDEAQLEQVTEFMINYCSSADDATFQQWYDTSDFNKDLQLAQSGLPISGKNFAASLKGWQAGVAECGAYVSHGEYEYSMTNGKIEAKTDAQFQDRNGSITFVFDKESNLESITINADMSMGEVLEKAGLNTLLGMGTVFSVLILIAFIISLFRFIPALTDMFKKKEKKNETPAAESVTESAPVAAPEAESTVTDDMELIAVISAAIAAAEGTSTDGFVVRSIKRRTSNKWNSR